MGDVIDLDELRLQRSIARLRAHGVSAEAVARLYAAAEPVVEPESRVDRVAEPRDDLPR